MTDLCNRAECHDACTRLPMFRYSIGHAVLRRSLPAALLLTTTVLTPSRAQIAPSPVPPGVWQPREFAFITGVTGQGGARLTETTASPYNPWLDWRMVVTLTGPSGQIYLAHGFYAADGRGGDSGDIWKVRFSPDEAGTWNGSIAFEYGADLNVADLGVAGTPTGIHGATFSFSVTANLPRPGFHATGPLEYVGEHYLRFRNGRYFLKGGTDSPENFLAYSGFDNLQDQGGDPPGGPFLHDYGPHIGDWNAGDPDWASGGNPNAGRGIIGALNYLADEAVNSIYFLPNNLGGDGEDCYPFVSAGGTTTDNTHYDVGRMEQWNVVFTHAQRKGILLHFVLAEQEFENTTWFGGTALNTERKLFFKLLASMFSHHMAIKWNFCEENSAAGGDEFSVAELQAFADYLGSWTTWAHPMAVHIDPNDLTLYTQIEQAGGTWLTATSLQLHHSYGADVEAARAIFAPRKVIIDQDEQGPPGTGLTDTNHDNRRRDILWDVYLSGANIEWYFGYHPLPLGGDLRTEDFRTRDDMWRFMRYARKLIESFEFWNMEPHDNLLSGEDQSFGGGEVFARLGVDYIVYFPNASATGTLDLTHTSPANSYRGEWFNPRDGSAGGGVVFSGGGSHVPGPPPANPNLDWVYTVREL